MNLSSRHRAVVLLSGLTAFGGACPDIETEVAEGRTSGCPPFDMETGAIDGKDLDEDIDCDGDGNVDWFIGRVEDDDDNVFSIWCIDKLDDPATPVNEDLDEYNFKFYRDGEGPPVIIGRCPYLRGWNDVRWTTDADNERILMTWWVSKKPPPGMGWQSAGVIPVDTTEFHFDVATGTLALLREAPPGNFVCSAKLDVAPFFPEELVCGGEILEPPLAPSTCAADPDCGEDFICEDTCVPADTMMLIIGGAI